MEKVTKAAVKVLESVIASDACLAAHVISNPGTRCSEFDHEGGGYQMTTLGIVNAILGSLGADRVSVEFDTNPDTPNKALGVSAWKKPEGETDGGEDTES